CRLDERDVRRGGAGLGVRALDPSSTLGLSLSLSVSAGVPGIRALGLSGILGRGAVGRVAVGRCVRVRRRLVVVDDLDVELVDDHTRAAGDLGLAVVLPGLGVGTAAVAEVDHAAVGRGPLVGAHAELGAQGAGELHQEAAAGAARRDRALAAAGGGLAGAELAGQPALGGLAAALLREHAGAAESQLPEGDAVLVL